MKMVGAYPSCFCTTSGWQYFFEVFNGRFTVENDLFCVWNWRFWDYSVRIMSMKKNFIK